jgi:hypothetical protein
LVVVAGFQFAYAFAHASEADSDPNRQNIFILSKAIHSHVQGHLRSRETRYRGKAAFFYLDDPRFTDAVNRGDIEVRVQRVAIERRKMGTNFEIEKYVRTWDAHTC